MVRFSVGREDRVDRVMLFASWGHAALDDETLALLECASPPPPEADGGPLVLTVPVQYVLRCHSRPGSSRAGLWRAEALAPIPLHAHRYRDAILR